jgi:hypothetical protein
MWQSVYRSLWSFGPRLGPPFYTSKGIPQTSVKLLYAVATLGGSAIPAVLHADWHAALMGQDRLVSLVFTLPGTQCCLLLARRSGFPRAGHESFIAGDACHALIPNELGVALYTPLTAPS